MRPKDGLLSTQMSMHGSLQPFSGTIYSQITRFAKDVLDKGYSFIFTCKNVAYLTSCGRSRWKIENEYNNVLKNHGYNLEHNLGHGKNHAGDMYCC